jgi:hypothetical protein
VRLGLPAIDWWWWFGRGGRRRAAAAEQRRGGRGGSDGGEDRGVAQHCVAREASMWPREGATGVPGLGGSAEGRARQWRSSGGRGSSGCGETPVLLDHQARLEAHVWAREELRATGRSRG